MTGKLGQRQTAILCSMALGPKFETVLLLFWNLLTGTQMRKHSLLASFDIFWPMTVVFLVRSSWTAKQRPRGLAGRHPGGHPDLRDPSESPRSKARDGRVHELRNKRYGYVPHGILESSLRFKTVKSTTINSRRLGAGQCPMPQRQNTFAAKVEEKTCQIKRCLMESWHFLAFALLVSSFLESRCTTEETPSTRCPYRRPVGRSHEATKRRPWDDLKTLSSESSVIFQRNILKACNFCPTFSSQFTSSPVFFSHFFQHVRWWLSSFHRAVCQFWGLEHCPVGHPRQMPRPKHRRPGFGSRRFQGSYGNMKGTSSYIWCW